ncbi:DJ-1/PfpI family protein [Elongatibacter sediminis]|uniref:DJ-1/PfpI family protein n=1 Tax=Elongatibacter sediminis TaxID=3119006 RepID=A0AAW9RB39_9GAMM
MQTAILLFDGMTVLDAIGPYEVLQSVPGVEVCFVAREKGEIRSDFKRLGLMADFTLAEVPQPDILIIPGTPFPESVTGDPAVLDWIRGAHESSTWTTSVCTGALGLGAAGVLEGRRATTHWLALDALKAFGATPVEERVVRDGKVWTAAGVSSGIDMALALVGEQFGDEAAQAAQLIIEYDPQPPCDAGSVKKAPAPLVAALREQFGDLMQGTGEA